MALRSLKWGFLEETWGYLRTWYRYLYLGTVISVPLLHSLNATNARQQII
jgi:hypothetical protein